MNLIWITTLGSVFSCFDTFIANFSNIIAPSMAYLTILVASSPHPIQNREFFFALDVKGSILFNVFNNDISNYIEGTL